MNKTEIMNKLTKAVGKTQLQLKKHSPEILLVGGIVGIVASGVLACIATTKLSDTLEQPKTDIENIHKAAEEGVICIQQKDSEEVVETEFTEQDKKRALAVAYAKTGFAVAKLYAPSVALGTLSIISLLASNDIMRKRNVALAAAYTAVDRSFRDYRNNVIERFGEVVDRELKYNIKNEKIEEVVTDPETGKEKKVKKTVPVSDGRLNSPYARFYDDGCKGWEKDAEMNMFFLRAEEQLATDRLRARGWLTLNEVYERLGIPVTNSGARIGWIYNPDDPEWKGDNYVDFGICDIYRVGREERKEFVNGRERTIILDFNVDGPIDHLIEKYQRLT